MKSKLTIFIVIAGLVFVSLLRVNAIVTAPPTRAVPLTPPTATQPDDVPPPVAIPKPIVQPQEPIITPPSGIQNPVPTNPNNTTQTQIDGGHNLLVSTLPIATFALPIYCCCILGIGVIALTAFAIFLIKKKEKKLAASPLLTDENNID